MVHHSLSFSGVRTAYDGALTRGDGLGADIFDMGLEIETKQLGGAGRTRCCTILASGPLVFLYMTAKHNIPNKLK
jgi:hypothetical protein